MHSLSVILILIKSFKTSETLFDPVVLGNFLVLKRFKDFMKVRKKSTSWSRDRGFQL